MRTRFDVDVNAQDVPLTEDDLRSAMRHYDALCPTVSDTISDRVIMAPRRRVRILANYGAGLDHIDLTACRRAALSVTNTPEVLTDCTADLAIMLLLMTARRAGEGERELRAGRWTGGGRLICWECA